MAEGEKVFKYPEGTEGERISFSGRVRARMCGFGAGFISPREGKCYWGYDKMIVIRARVVCWFDQCLV